MGKVKTLLGCVPLFLNNIPLKVCVCISQHLTDSWITTCNAMPLHGIVGGKRAEKFHFELILHLKLSHKVLLNGRCVCVLKFVRKIVGLHLPLEVCFTPLHLQWNFPWMFSNNNNLSARNQNKMLHRKKSSASTQISTLLLFSFSLFVSSKLCWINWCA